MRGFATALPCIAVLVLGLLAPAGAQAAAAEGSNGIAYKVLVFTKATAERHTGATTAGVTALRELGIQRRFTVEVTDDARKFDKEHLKQFRAVVFLNTSGDVLDARQQAAFEDYYRDGGGFLGVHSAIETEADWAFFSDLLGTRATSESDFTQATVKVADRVHEASKTLPEYWKRSDRWYSFKSNVRGFSHVLATVDEKTYTGGTNGFDHPISWCKDYKGGRSFYVGGGHSAGAYAEPDFREHLAGAVEWAAGVADPAYSDCGATVLANYQMKIVSAPPNVNEPIGFDVLPDGRVLQTDRRGGVRLHDPESGNTTILANLPVYTNSEDGLYGPAIDNDFASNKWVYLYYAPLAMEPPYPATTPTGSAPTTGADPSVWDRWRGYFQLSRFKFVDASGDQPARLDLASEQKILKVENNRGACCHVAGDIAFDSKNNLWLVTGDDTPAGGGNSGGFSPFNDMLTTSGLHNTPHVDARRTSLNTNDLRGKVLRIKVGADGDYTVPDGNLFPEAQDADDKTRPEIYAMGLRNPFRITLDENDVAYVTDYSPDAQTPQALRGPAGTGRVAIVREPSNYGWPLCYSPDLPYFKWNFNTSTTEGEPFECDNPAKGPDNTSRWNTGRVQTPPITAPDIWYSYRDNATPPLGTPCFESYGSATPAASCPQLFPELGTGGVGPHGAAPYDYDADNPNPTKFPPYYDGSFILGEFTRDWLREVRLDEDGKVFKINEALNCGQAPTTATKPFLCDNPMDMRFGRDGTFYLLTYGDGFFAMNPDAAMEQISYVKGRRAPNAVLRTDRTDGIAPLTVQFRGDESSDADPGDSIRFAWDFDGDGETDSIDPNPSHTYTANGVYTAKLTVTDSSGKTDAKTTTITVGNTSPTIEIATPVDGGFFEWGQSIPYEVTVTDPEDGTVDCADVEVTFVLVHDQHGHAEEDQRGCSGVLPTLAESASHGGYLAGGISVSYTDKGANGQPALTTTRQHVVQAKRHEVEYAIDQAGTGTAGTADAGGGSQRNAIDDGDWIALNNRINLLNMDPVLRFRHSGGSAATAGQQRVRAEIHAGSPDGPTVGSAALPATTGNGAYTTTEVPLTFAGSQRLYLVFRSVTGGPATNMVNLNWVEFTGSGVGATP